MLIIITKCLFVSNILKTKVWHHHSSYCAISIVSGNRIQKRLDQYDIWWCHNICLKYMFIIVTKWYCLSNSRTNEYTLKTKNCDTIIQQIGYCAIQIVSGNRIQKELGQCDLWWCCNYCLKYMYFSAYIYE